MDALTLDGSYADSAGVVPVVWTIASSERVGWAGRFEITATIRGARVSGAGFESLDCDDRAEGISVNAAGELDNCTLTVRVPAAMADGYPDGRLVLEFFVGAGRHVPIVKATITVGERSYLNQQDEVLEVVLGNLVEQLKPTRWECCLTCLLSDYNPGGQQAMGMRCHRDVRAQYLAITSKAQYWDVPVTEEVPEFYRCNGYEPRVPGTGYRG
jgi:hypothetical protein